MTETMHDRLRKRLKAVKMNPNEASAAAGLSRGYLQTVFNRENQNGGASGRALARLAPVLKTSVDYLLDGTGPEEVVPETRQDEDARAATPDFPPKPGEARREASRELPVYGLAAGAVAGQLTMTNDAIEYVGAPEALAKVKDAYALIVTGSSMEPRYFAGDVIFLHPHRPVRPGDHVVVQEALHGGTVVSIKRFERMTDGFVVTTQYNPLAEVKFRRETVIAMHRVLTPNEVAGV